MTSLAATPRFRSFLREHPVVAIIAAGAVLCAVAVGLVAIDPRPWVERLAGAQLDRRVTIGALEVGWRAPLRIEARDVKLANTAWGTRPDMVAIERVVAEIDPLAMVVGGPWLRVVEIVKPDIVLERGPDGTGNWVLSGKASTATTPRPRTLLPALRQARIADGRLSFRTSSGALLRVAVRALDIEAPDPTQPVIIAAEGAYNDVPVRLRVRAPSFDDMRAKPGPLPVTFTATTAMAEVQFVGAMADPLAFDGIDGALEIDAADLRAMLAIVGADTAGDGEKIALKLAGTFRRTGDRWTLVDARGRLIEGDFTGTFSLTEAARGQPDEIDIAARFERLDLDTLASRLKAEDDPPASADADLLSIDFEENRGTHFDLRLEAATLVARKLELTQAAIAGRLASDGARLDRLRFGFAGGTVAATGSVRPLAEGGRIVAELDIDEIDAGRIARILDIGGGQVAGKLSGRAEIEASGKTLDAAIRASRGHAVLAMTQGRIARRLLEMASTDLRSVFRRDEGRVRISCLLGVVSLEAGRATLQRLRLETPVTTLVGGGHVDLAARRLDVTVKSIASSTGFFALDIPIRLTGRLSNPRIDPLIGESARWLDGGAGGRATDALPPRLQELVAGNRCAR